MEQFLECDMHVLRIVFRLLRRWLPKSRELDALTTSGCSGWSMRCDFPERPARAEKSKRRAMRATLRSERHSGSLVVRGDGKVTLSSGGSEERTMGSLPKKVVPLCLTLLSKLPSTVEYATCRFARSEERQSEFVGNVFEKLCCAINLDEERPALVLHEHGDGEAVLCALPSTGATERTVRVLEEKGAKSAFFLANGVSKCMLRVCMQQSLTAGGEPSDGATGTAGLPAIRGIFRCPQMSRRGKFFCEDGVCDDSEAFEIPRSCTQHSPLVELLCELAIIAVTRGLICGRAAYPLLVFEDEAFMSCVLGLFRTTPLPVIESMTTSYLSLRGKQKVGDISELCLKPHDPSKHYLKHVNAFREGHSVTWSYRSKSLRHHRAIVLIRLLEPAIGSLEEARADCRRLMRPADWIERHRLDPSALVAVWTCACAYVRARLKRGVTEFSSWESAREALVARGPSEGVPCTILTKTDTDFRVRLKHLFSLFQLRKFRVRKLFDMTQEVVHHRICTESMKATRFFKNAARNLDELYAMVASCVGGCSVVKNRDGDSINVKLSRTNDDGRFQLSQTAW
eukprot:gene25327-30916_t